jgi:hypothetical protein
MTFEEMMMCMLLSHKCSTQCALRRYFASIGKPISMKQQSYSQARAKINAEAFVELFRMTSVTLVEMNHKKWHGYRVCAVDGTKIALPADKKLSEYYGTAGRGQTSPTAQGSILYDVLNDIVLDAAIEPISYDERTLAAWHLNVCDSVVPESKKLVIFDSGEQEMLITNIADKRLGIAAFKNLYFMRWPVETKFDAVKNKLHIEHFSSRTVNGIRQDFFATMYLANVAAAAVHDANPIIQQERAGKDNKYEYHANLNEAIGVLKDRLIHAFTVDDPDFQVNIIKDIVKEISSYVTPYRPNRSNPRGVPRKSRFHHNRRANC